MDGFSLSQNIALALVALAVAAPQELVLRNCRGFTFDRTIFDDCTQNHLQGAEQ